MAKCRLQRWCLYHLGISSMIGVRVWPTNLRFNVDELFFFSFFSLIFSFDLLNFQSIPSIYFPLDLIYVILIIICFI